MIRDIEAKTILSRVRGEDLWFGLYYGMNLYRGCQHRCIYCDSRSECYRIEYFDRDVLIKANAIDLLTDELVRKRVIGTIGTGSMNDPYMPLERRVGLTRRALEAICAAGFPVHIITKSDLVLRDTEILSEIQAQTFAAVSFSITAADDTLSRILEPGASPSSRRFAAIQDLSHNGILTGVTLMPVLPFIEDTEENVRNIAELAADSGARYIIPGFGVTLRDRQRSYYYQKLDEHFPGLRRRYEQAFGNHYSAPARNTGRLQQVLEDVCAKHGISTSMPRFTPLARRTPPRARAEPGQPGLFAP